LDLGRVELSTADHDRNRAGATYVYPVVSRRARGVSIGVNLNTNDACNWRCVYCQVPGLVRGKAPDVDLGLLERELDELVAQASSPEWLERHAPSGFRRLNDVALSGNGEPTSSPRFAEVIELAARVLERRGLAAEVKLIVITNGSLVHLDAVQAGLRRMARARGEVWFKLDAASDAGIARVNDVATGVERQRRNLATAARIVPTWVQTMALDFDGPTFDAGERETYCRLLRGLLDEQVPLRGVLLYGLARESHQPEAARLRALPPAELEAFAEQIRTSTELPVEVSS
jgi:wyosine [tRNA(Phe)-imidazoG37] synthetase (radical SAM superfamily)